LDSALHGFVVGFAEQRGQPVQATETHFEEK
jgi:hypothetical protein